MRTRATDSLLDASSSRSWLIPSSALAAETATHATVTVIHARRASTEHVFSFYAVVFSNDPFANMKFRATPDWKTQPHGASLPPGPVVTEWLYGVALALPVSQTPPVSGRLLPRQFYARDALDVARDLLGQEIWHGTVGLRITEVEAYRYPDDSANHCRAGLTMRNAPMWGPPGRAYVYLCYGLHQMLNLVTNRDGEGAAVLIRSCEPIAGHRVIRRRRHGKEGTALLTGPGKVGQALGLDTTFSGRPLYRRGGLEVREGTRATEIAVGSRIGIGYAEPEHQHAEWRLAIAGSPWVSHVSQLRGVQA